MKAFVDFHIHTALSPCGDNDMTPNNIVNMAKIKGLDAIAITDHNSCENVLSCMKAGEKANLVVIPGMELQTREDIHVICLFSEIEKAVTFQELIYSLLPNMKNNEEIFGEQLLLSEEDEVIRHTSKLLLTSADISFDDAFRKVEELGGVFIPAHIDRQNFSIINSLGFIPDYLNIKWLEYRSSESLDKMIKTGLVKEKYNFIKSSDAHYLWDILERETYIDTPSLKCDNIINSLLNYNKLTFN